MTEAPERETRAERAVFWLYTGLDGIALAVVLLFALESVHVGGRVADYGVPIGLALLFVALPPAAAAIAWLRWKSGRPPSPGRRAYYAVSRLFLAIAWLPGALLAFLLATVLEPWPLSLRQGPDTEHARAGFAQRFHFEPPTSVTGLHYRAEELRDATYRVSFDCADRAVVERIVAELGLEPVPAESIQSLRDPYLRREEWWGRDRDAAIDAAWARGGHLYYLWYASARSRVFFKEMHL